MYDAEVRAGLLDALKSAAASPEACSIVLASEVGALAADLPIQERLQGQDSPTLSELCAWLEAAPKPVVATLRGGVYDAGFELVLAAHARVAQQSARVRLSRLASGAMPDPHALVTLAASLGAETSLRLLARRESLSAADEALAPLFEDIVGQNAVGRAAEVARVLADSFADGQPREAAIPGAQDPLAYQMAIQTGRDTPHPSPEHRTLVDALEAAQLLPKPALIAFITERNTLLAASEQSAAKAYEVCCKEALLTRQSQSPATKRITLVGTSALARNLTLAALGSGVGVDVLALSEGGYEAHFKAVSEAYSELVKRRLLSETQARTALSGMAKLPELDGLVQSEFVIECGAKSVEQIGQLADSLRGRLGADVPLLLTAGMRHGAGRFSGLLADNTAGAHFHFARHSGSYVELAFQDESFSKETVRNAFAATLQQIGLPVVAQRAQDGLASARLLTAYLQGVEECLALGASFEQVERALVGRLPPLAYQNAEGFRLQPFRISTFFIEDEASDAPPAFSGYMLRAGFEGRDKASAQDMKTGTTLPKANAVLEAWRADIAAKGAIKARKLSDAEVCQIVDTALYCTGSTLLENGSVTTPWELDYLCCATLEAKPGYGGPFHKAQTRGLLNLRSFLRGFTPLRPTFFQTPETLDEMIKTGSRYLQPYQRRSTRF